MSTGNDCTQSSSVLTNTTLRHYTVRHWDETITTIETSLKAVASLQRCIKIKTPTLRFDFECLFYYFTLIVIFSLTEHGTFSRTFYTAWKHRLSHKKIRLDRRLYIILTIICHFQGNADWNSSVSMLFNLPLCSIRGHASIKIITHHISHAQSRAIFILSRKWANVIQ